MSRHRNVRNLIDEDDYYDYDDDYDDYDDYQDYGSNVPNNSQHSKPTSLPAPKQVPKQKQSTPTATATSSVGVSKPPPGWGKPSPTQSVSKPATSNTGATKLKLDKSQTPGITKPPIGWGKPTVPVTTPDGSRSKSPTQKPTNQPSTTRQVPSILKQPPETNANGNQENQLSMVVIGHVDAGKSTMLGQLLYQVGQITKRQATKISTSSSNPANSSTNPIQWAWLLDEDEGERNRGVTMQIATKTISTPKHPRIVVLDAPGHADFVPTMITGTANAEAALLVVDASAESAFEAAFHRGGQTKEHVLLARGLGVSQLIVCVNKLDVRDWSQQVFQDIQQRLTPFLTQHANFNRKRIRFVPTSGLTGANVKDPSNIPPKLRQWYTGPTLFQAIDSFQPVKQTSLDQPLRIVLSDVYAEGKNVNARGKVIQGFLEAGEDVVVLPIGDIATVSSIDHLHALSDPQRLKYAVVGETVDLTITGIDNVRVSTGSILSRPDVHARPAVAKKVKAKIVVMEDLAIPIIRGTQALFHIHSLDVPAVLTQLIETTKRGNNATTKNRPRAITAASSAVVEITLSNPICIEPFSKCRALGRFVLRRSGDTIAVGIIEEILPP